LFGSSSRRASASRYEFRTRSPQHAASSTGSGSSAHGELVEPCALCVPLV
jgi:hypothetical protein